MFEVIDNERVGYLTTETTSGSLNDIYIKCNTRVLKLQECLIWDDELFSDEEFAEILEHCEANNGIGQDEFEGWSIVK
jgi:hypothetical protein